MKNKIIKALLLLSIILFFTTGYTNNAYAKQNFTVTPKKVEKMAKKNHKTYYNAYTKHYFGLNDYLDKMQKAGGGTLTVKKGTYKISNAVYVPSNVTIIFEDGVVFQKISKTGTKAFKASGSMWQLCPHNKSKKKNSIGKYNGTKNVKFIAKGKVTFDMKGVIGICIAAAHNKNVEISGITFRGMNGDHYIEVNGTKDAYIHDNTFLSAKKSTLNNYYMKEAINIDLADATTNGIPLNWVKKDKTPCVDIKIENNVFDGTTRGVGSHKFSQKGSENVYHQNIIINNNVFKNIYDNGVFPLNWKNTTITNNIFENIGNRNNKSYSSGAHAIAGGGVTGMKITGNKFSKIKRNIIYFAIQQNVGAGSQYKKVSTMLTNSEVQAMLNNEVSECGNDINNIFAGYDVLYFKGNSERTKENAVGVNIKTGEINEDFTKKKEN